MKVQKSKTRKPLMIAGIVLLALLVVYFAFVIYFSNHFLFHTTINGLDSAGYSVAKVEDEITSEIESYSVTMQERDNKEEVIKGQDIDLAPQFDGSLQATLDSQNAFAWIGSIFKKSDYSLKTMVTYDEESLTGLIEGLACMDASNQEEPVSATVSDYTKGEGYTIVPAEYGTTVDESKLISTVEEQILQLNTEFSLEDTGCYVDPEVTEDTQELMDAVDTLNKYVSSEITYDFGDESEVLDASTLNEWLSVSDDLSVNVDAEALSDYVQKLAANHNTAGRSKELTTSDGVEVTVPGGNYGWKIDQAAEREQLLSDIESGSSVERDPEYAQTAQSHGDKDYGNTYVEINLTSQHIYFYKNGSLVVSTDFVSGNVSHGNATPTGAYFVNSKETERTLKGPDYSSFVHYWMPFCGDVGMHDATWRSSFGGNIYLTNGSHGCVNLPLSAAKSIFESIEVGDAVLVYQTVETPSTTTAASIVGLIDTIGPVTLESQTIISTIRTQYDALTDEEKANVTNYDTLVSDEAQLAQLQSQVAQ